MNRGMVHNKGLPDQIFHRETNTKKSKFIKGNRKLLRELWSRSKGKIEYEITIVQPGFRKSVLDDGMAYILASANDYILASACGPLKIVCRE